MQRSGEASTVTGRENSNRNNFDGIAISPNIGEEILIPQRTQRGRICFSRAWPAAAS